ncbi:MAG: hypothetical protein K6T83_22220, partial [Alicyclobacillus sp.]|nr:hypothetical protein [Alicyclobacillus sp.]
MSRELHRVRSPTPHVTVGSRSQFRAGGFLPHDYRHPSCRDQSGIFKVRGVATWVLAFLYVVGLINRCPSVNALATFFNTDGLLQRMLGIQRVTQSALSRFLTGFSQWDMFNQKRTARLQEDPDTALA